MLFKTFESIIIQTYSISYQLSLSLSSIGWNLPYLSPQGVSSNPIFATRMIVWYLSYLPRLKMCSISEMVLYTGPIANVASFIGAGILLDYLLWHYIAHPFLQYVSDGLTLPTLKLKLALGIVNEEDLMKDAIIASDLNALDKLLEVSNPNLKIYYPEAVYSFSGLRGDGEIAAVCLAAKFSLSAFEKLLIHGADPNTACYISYFYPQQIDSLPYYCAAYGVEGTLITLIKRYGVNVNALSDTLYYSEIMITPLLKAMIRGQDDVVEKLKNNGANIDVPTADGLPSLFFARCKCHSKAIKFLSNTQNVLSEDWLPSLEYAEECRDSYYSLDSQWIGCHRLEHDLNQQCTVPKCLKSCNTRWDESMLYFVDLD